MIYTKLFSTLVLVCMYVHTHTYHGIYQHLLQVLISVSNSNKKGNHWQAYCHLKIISEKQPVLVTYITTNNILSKHPSQSLFFCHLLIQTKFKPKVLHSSFCWIVLQIGFVPLFNEIMICQVYVQLTYIGA